MKKLLLKFSLLMSFAVFTSINVNAQLNYNFDTDGDFEGFVLAGNGGPSGVVSGGLLTVTTGIGNNTQLRRNNTDLGDPSSLTRVIISLKNNSNADILKLQSRIGSITYVIEEITITTGNIQQQSYMFDVPGTPPITEWNGTLRIQFRFESTAGDLDGGAIEIDNIEVIDPATLDVTENDFENISVYSNNNYLYVIGLRKATEVTT